MGHEHDHGHHHADAGTALAGALVLNGGFLLVEAVVGWWTGSLALLSDAAHMLSDVGALVLALAASQLARRAPTPDQSWGLVRAETLGAFVNGLALLVAVVVIVKAAVGRLLSGVPELDAAPIVVVGVVGLLINLGSAAWLMRSDTHNLNVRGALLHMLADALGSVGAVVAGVLVARGYGIADPIASLAIAALVLVGTWGLLRDASRVLLQFAPAGVRPAEVREALLAIDGVVDVHDLHIWTIDGQHAVLSAHLTGGPDRSTEDLRRAAEHVLHERFGVEHTTLQTELHAECAQARCPLDPSRDHAHDHHHHVH